MPITNGYATLAEFKAYAVPDGAADLADDAVIEDIIEAASRYIDGRTGRTFYSRTNEARKFNTPEGRELWLDDDLQAITTLTNGDGSTIAASAYVLLPNNYSPKYAIKLREGNTIVWEEALADNSPEQAITVLGTWGFSSTAPDDIKTACIMIADAFYRRRFGENVSGVAQVTAAGVVISPIDVPASAAAILRPYMRIVP
jgi:hypothetical protein